MALTAPRRWRIGDVTVTQLVETVMVTSAGFLFANLDAPAVRARGWLRPSYATQAGELRWSIHCFIVESRGRTIVVDTCVGNDKVRSVAEWHRLSGPFLSDFAAAGFALDEVDVVLCTHLHLDHVGWNTRLIDGRWTPTFPRARYLLGRGDYERLARADDANSRAVMADSLQPVLDAGLVDWVASDHAITDEVRLEPTPGHTPGHVSVRIRSTGVEAVITGDLMHHPIQVEDPRIAARYDADPAQALATRLRFLREQADRDVLVLGSHFAPPSAGRLVTDGTAWRFDVAAAEAARNPKPDENVRSG